jgi:hypothetical protein
MKHPELIFEIEVVLEDLKTMNCIENFPNLKSLTFIKTNIGKIEVTIFQCH